MGCEQSTEANAMWASHSNRGSSKTDVTQDTLEQYLALEQRIASAEHLSPGVASQHKREQLEQLRAKMADQQILVERLEQQTQKEKSDVDHLEGADTRQLFMEQKKMGVWESEQQQEMQEYLDAKNREEIAKKELANLAEQAANFEKEMEELDKQNAELIKLYEEQEVLLNEIFGGAYGSEVENQLEASLDQHEAMRVHIVEANFKWRQAQLMVDYAYRQLEHAVNKWMEIPALKDNELEAKYAVASETRNNLVAAAQNISGAQRYLNTIDFPYCAPPEVDTLNKATAYIFTDMQTPERHEHALDCYTVTSKRCGALLQWINQVVNQTISQDLAEMNAKVKSVSKELREERIRLIQAKIKEVLGKDVQLENFDVDVNTDVQVTLNHNELAKTDGLNPSGLRLLSDSDLADLDFLEAGEELAPMPSLQEVFGEELERLNKEYEADQSRLQSQRAAAQRRVAHNLEEKLAARRMRRARKNLEKKERKAIKK